MMQQSHGPRTPTAHSGTEEGMKRATYEELESIEADLSGYPTTNFFKIDAVIRPWRLPSVVQELSNKGIRGLTTSMVKGVGAQGGSRERYAGTEFSLTDLVDKARGGGGGGTVNQVVLLFVARPICSRRDRGFKIFVKPIVESSERTAETGAIAEHMQGGMSDLLSHELLGSSPQ
ncbi:MAG: hypothetical protein WDW38_005859 [Sanguina aurantia]